ncbi:Kinetochore-associated protein NNF1 like [Verticillium longisporum]|uniref:Uncharacterized protein n=2 Tax=Verticillium TaxID=1036719 RepID=A0A2J8DE20_VERDA|nr:Putative gluconokinase [Verticillium dahliae VDG2]KAG7142852.1 Kinetochore-associated protein NNF1 like [Verticillium longisporum]PNH35146.1 hypothetical protein BJF96_g1639 [Verticillium dahliae]PNH42679.1 hypothetical protein VD0004_g4653 [Verticillium dahliae]PNH47514.1 hypothetical protein VD0003_g8801 [Verticillium dahliae]
MSQPPPSDNQPPAPGPEPTEMDTSPDNPPQDPAPDAPQQQPADQDEATAAAAAAAAPASPPLPEKHTPVAPGYRAARFIKMYDEALRRTLARVKYDNFAACFPTIAAHAPNALRNVQKQMVDYLEDRCNKDFQAILDERDLVRKLNELEALVAEADRQKGEHPADAPEPIPPHSLPPEAVIKGHLHPPLAHAYSHLSAALQNTRMENEDLFTTIQAQRAEMDALLADLDGVVADIDGANDLLGQVAPELAAEARKADSGIAGM